MPLRSPVETVDLPAPPGTPDSLLDTWCRGAAPRTLLLAAHPDDEAVGAGSRLPHLRDLILLHVTDGSPRDLRDARAHGFASREEYAQARREEVTGALAAAGRSASCARSLGIVDQEASLHLAELTWRIAKIVGEVDPVILVLHPYEGGHPDHDAVAFAGHAACALLRREGRQVPALLEMTSYHHDAGRIRTGEFLPRDGFEPLTVRLTPEEQERKRRLMACYRTQQETLRQFPLDREQFRHAPSYDFTQPPHAGTLYYELFPWGMTGQRFRALAAQALRELELAGTR